MTFPGWIHKKSEFYHAIDVFCLPSTHEPFGIVLLEAMSYRVPIVSTDSEGPTDFLEHQKTAIITAKNNPTELADAIERVLKDSVLASNIASDGFALVKERFTHSTSGRLLTTAIESVLQKELSSRVPMHVRMPLTRKV